MKSPFPGMDPYLERNWRDVHARLIVYICDQIQGQPGGPLRARVEERLVVESDDAGPPTVYPDARIFESSKSARQGVALAGSATVAEPLIVRKSTCSRWWSRRIATGRTTIWITRNRPSRQ
jgi:hypothetical protein